MRNVAAKLGHGHPLRAQDWFVRQRPIGGACAKRGHAAAHRERHAQYTHGSGFSSTHLGTSGLWGAGGGASPAAHMVMTEDDDMLYAH